MYGLFSREKQMWARWLGPGDKNDDCYTPNINDPQIVSGGKEYMQTIHKRLEPPSMVQRANAQNWSFYAPEWEIRKLKPADEGRCAWTTRSKFCRRL